MPTPSPDTVEPTEADTLLAGHFVMQTDARGIGAARMAQEWAQLIRQHVAAEVARETARAKKEISSAVELWLTQTDGHLEFASARQKALVELRAEIQAATAHKSSPPPPAS